MRALIAVTALPVLMFALAHGGRAAGPHTRTSEPFAGGPALAGRRLQGEDLPAPAPPGEGRQGEPLDHGARLRSRGGQGADLVRLRRDAARRGRVRQAGQVATTAQRARPDAPPASPRRLFGESRTPTSSAACARVGSSRRVDGFTRRPSASSVSTPRRGVPPRRSRAVIGPVRLHSSMPIVQARRFRVDPSASETRKVVGEGAAPTSRASEGGTIAYVAPVSTRNRTLALRRAKTRAST